MCCKYFTHIIKKKNKKKKQRKNAAFKQSKIPLVPRQCTSFMLPDSSGRISDLPFLLPCTAFVGTHLTELGWIMLECLWTSLFLLFFMGWASLFTGMCNYLRQAAICGCRPQTAALAHHIFPCTCSTWSGERTTQGPSSWCSVDGKCSYFSKLKDLNQQRKWRRLFNF